MNRTKIDWPGLKFTWNPIIGCKRGCYYCYAKKINDRFKFIPNWNEPQFFEERLHEPYEVKKPSTIFVGSMSGMFEYTIKPDWFFKILNVCKDNPHHTFMFLTKNPKAYYLPIYSNCMLGLTITKGNQNEINEFIKHSNGKRFLSIEPLLDRFEGIKFDGIDLIIVGAMTGKNAIKPKKEWIESIKHHNIYYKNNIKKYLS